MTTPKDHKRVNDILLGPLERPCLLYTSDRDDLAALLAGIRDLLARPDRYRALYQPCLLYTSPGW